MPFIPHTEQDVKEMLERIGINSINQLFDEIPDSLKHAPLDGVPSGMSEMALGRIMRERAKLDGGMTCFIGAGAYEHHIPAAVWDVATRGEFYTAYTPYQAEASQGSLQLIYEYQSMMASLMSLDISNASLYDGASSLAEAILMAVRLSKNKTQILMPLSISPFYRDTVKSIVSQLHIELIDIPFNESTGTTEVETLATYLNEKVAALVIPNPNFFGALEDVDALTNWAKHAGLLTIAVVNPLAMSLLKPPGKWGNDGVDIACGEGQALGIPLASGGPYYGFLCCKQSHVRQLPGRIVGQTVDLENKRGFVLTMQAREQHIRRAKATSNICTNQGLMVTASTIYMSLMGPYGLRQIALLAHERTRELKETLSKIAGVEVVFVSPFFHEVVLRLNKPVEFILKELAKEGIQGGFSLKEYYPQLGESMLVCATETKTQEDIAQYAHHLRDVLERRKVA